MQCFFWFVEEAGLLAWEYKAREGVVLADDDVYVEGQEKEDNGWEVGRARARARDRVGRRSLKSKIRLRDTLRGRAGLWRVE